MLIAKVSTLEFGTPSSLYPQTSFSESGPNQQWLDENECQIVDEPPYDPATQRLANCQPYVDSSGAIFRHAVIDLTPDEIAQLNLSKYEMSQFVMSSLVQEPESE